MYENEKNVQTGNLVKLVGTVLSKRIVSDELISLRLAVSSSTEENGYCSVYVYFYGKDAIAKIDSAIADHSRARVEVLGFVQTSKRIREIDGEKETHYYQDVVGISIAFAQNVLERMLDAYGVGRIKADSVNRFVCFGKVVSIFSYGGGRGRFNYITVKTWHNNYANFPQLICHSIATDRIVQELNKGDYIIATGEICSGENHSLTRKHKALLYISDLQKIENPETAKIMQPTLDSSDIIFSAI